jgi:hypothetical protein
MLLTKFDYQSICRFNHGDKRRALDQMINSFTLYYPKRSNFIARSRAKSAINLIRKLKEGIERRDSITTSKS